MVIYNPASKAKPVREAGIAAHRRKPLYHNSVALPRSPMLPMGRVLMLSPPCLKAPRAAYPANVLSMTRYLARVSKPLLGLPSNMRFMHVPKQFKRY